MDERIGGRPAHGRFRAATIAVIMVTALLLSLPDAVAGGSLSWARRYDGPAHADDVAYAVAASPDGTKVFSTGASTGDSSDYATVAYATSTGTRLWARRYDGPAQGVDTAVDVAVSPDGSSVFVTGYSQAKGGAGWATIGYDATSGATLWSRRHRGGATALAVSPDGSKVYVVGARPDAAGRLDYATIAYSARTGGTVWSRRYDGPAGLDDSPSDVFAASGAVFVSGSSFGSDATWGDFATVAYAQGNGTRLWVRRADGPAHGYDFVHAVDGSLDGSRVFVTGESDDRTGSGSSFSTVTYRGSTGERLWTRRYAKGSRSFALAGDATSDGSALYVTGVVTTTSANDFATIGYDGSTGERLWVRRYSSPGANTDTPLGVVVDPAATTVYVTGASYRGSDTGEDVTTFAYEASTGSTVWSRFYTSADANTDVGNAICVSPDGSQVFVAGSFDSSSPDLLTLAYTG